MDSMGPEVEPGGAAGAAATAEAARCRPHVARARAPGRGHRRPPAPRAHRQLAGRPPRHRAAPRRVAGPGSWCSAAGSWHRVRRGARRSSSAQHGGLTDALRDFAARRRLQVIVVMPPSDATPSLVKALERHGVTVRDGVDLRCETGAGTRTVLVRAGTLRRRQSAPRRVPAEDRPWLTGMERLDDPRLARRFVTSRAPLPPPAPLPLGAAAGAGRHRAPAAGRLRGRRARPRLPLTAAQTALKHAYAATWFSRFIVTVVIAARPGRPRPRGRPHVARHLAGARRRGAP